MRRGKNSDGTMSPPLHEVRVTFLLKRPPRASGSVTVESVGGDADDHYRSAVSHHADGLRDRRRKADYFERVIERPAGSRTSTFDGIAAARVDRVRRAELASPLELLWREVDSDDPIGTGDARALHDGQAHSAAADERDA